MVGIEFSINFDPLQVGNLVFPELSISYPNVLLFVHKYFQVNLPL